MKPLYKGSFEETTVMGTITVNQATRITGKHPVLKMVDGVPKHHADYHTAEISMTAQYRSPLDILLRREGRTLWDITIPQVILERNELVNTINAHLDDVTGAHIRIDETEHLFEDLITSGLVPGRYTHNTYEIHRPFLKSKPPETLTAALPYQH